MNKASRIMITPNDIEELRLDLAWCAWRLHTEPREFLAIFSKDPGMWENVQTLAAKLLTVFEEAI